MTRGGGAGRARRPGRPLRRRPGGHRPGRRRPRHRTAGQATVELAVALPLVLVALLVVVQAALVVARHVVTVHAAREAARAVAVDDRPGAAEQAAADAGGRDCRAAVTRPSEVGAVLTVRLTCAVATDVALVGPLVPDTTVTASASMRVER